MFIKFTIFLIFREQLKANELKGLYYLDFNYEDIDSHNEKLSNLLVLRPLEVIPLVSINIGR